MLQKNMQIEHTYERKREGKKVKRNSFPSVITDGEQTTAFGMSERLPLMYNALGGLTYSCRKPEKKRPGSLSLPLRRRMDRAICVFL